MTNPQELTEQMMEKLQGSRIGEVNGIPQLVPDLSVADAHDFIPNHMANIQSYIAGYNVQLGVIDGAIKEFPLENQQLLIPLIDIPDMYKEGCETLTQLREKIVELKTLNQGGLNFLSSIRANGYKIVSINQDSLLTSIERAQQTSQE